MIIMKQSSMHCKEVEKLMNKKTPFITRHGVTLIVIIFIIIGLFFWDSSSTAKSIIENILTETIGSLKLKL